MRARAVISLPLVFLLGAIASGCGGGSSSKDDTSQPSAGPVKVRAVTPPTADADLAEDLGSDGEALTTAGCTFGSYDEESPVHVDEASQLTWKSFPPASGTHFDTWAPFGRYDEPVADGYAVHNLEHGGVVVWIGTKVDDATEQAIGKLLDTKEKWLVAPRQDIDGLFSAAWATGLSCSPAALAKLGPDGTAEVLDAWYETVVSTGSEAEKDLPAYAGSMPEPTPEDDISEEAPF